MAKERELVYAVKHNGVEVRMGLAGRFEEFEDISFCVSNCHSARQAMKRVKEFIKAIREAEPSK